MKVQTALVGARAIDSLPFSTGATPDLAKVLKESGVDCFVGYLGSVSASRLAAILGAGLAFMPVTLAGEYEDGAADEVAQLRALGIPAGTSVWLDLEGMTAWKSSPSILAAKINEWAKTIAAGGWMPCLYVGAPQPFTSAELSKLAVVRYWWGLGRCVDRYGALAEPDCGWCMIQHYHGQPNGMFWRDTGIFVDANGIQCDYRKRLPAWVVAG